jgi:hypothetical protein
MEWSAASATKAYLDTLRMVRMCLIIFHIFPVLLIFFINLNNEYKPQCSTFVFNMYVLDFCFFVHIYNRKKRAL